MKRYWFLILVLFLTCFSYAQYKTTRDRRDIKNVDYLLHIGDTIKFFPVNPNFTGTFPTDYSCFYDIICLEKGVKPKYRFAINNQKLTPKSEIEDHYFYVKKFHSEEFKEKNNMAYFAILERISDHAQICLAFPKDLTKDISIINSWLVKGESVGNLRATNSLVIPYLPKWLIDKINSLEGETLLFKNYFLRDYEDYSMLKAVNGETKANNLSSTNGVPIGTEFLVGKMKFISCSSQMTYLQPYLSITNKSDDYLYRIPVSHYAGNSNNLYVIKGEIENLIQRHFVVKDEFLLDVRLKGERLDSLIGRVYHFNDGYKYSKEKDKYTIETRYLDKDKSYDLKESYYKCVGFDYFRPRQSKDLYYGQYVIFEDSIGQRFRFPVKITHRYYSQLEEYRFTDIFEPKEIYDAKIMAKEKKEKEEKQLINKYGNLAGIAIAGGKCTEQRFKDLCKKYGKKKAEYMARGWFRVGWTFREVKEAIGKEYFSCVYTHENKYDYWEVYKYNEYAPSYVTFKNSVVVSIDDYMNTDF